MTEDIFDKAIKMTSEKSAPKRSDNQALIPENLDESQIIELQEQMKNIHKERQENRAKYINPTAFEKPHINEGKEIILEYYRDKLYDIKEKLEDKKLYNEKNKPYVLIPKYHEVLNSIIRELGNELNANVINSMIWLSDEIADLIPEKTFGHTLETHNGKKFIAYLAYGLVHFGLNITATKELIGEWISLKKKISPDDRRHEKTIRDAIKILNEEKIDLLFNNQVSRLEIFESQIGLERRLFEIRFVEFPFKNQIHDFLSQEKEYSFNHPRAKPAFKKFKEFISRIEKAHKEREFLNKMWDEIDK